MKQHHFLTTSELCNSKHEDLLGCLTLQIKRDLHLNTQQVSVRGCTVYHIPYPLNKKYRVHKTIPKLPVFTKIDFVGYKYLEQNDVKKIPIGRRN